MIPAAAAALTGAVRAVARAEILPRYRTLSGDQIATKTGPTDLVTVADRAAEAALTVAARDILPGCAVVGEEAVETDRALLDLIATSQTCVIVDPVDGTSNFAHGLGVFGVILAVVERGRTVWGLLYDPLGDDWVAATRGQGAWYGRPGAAPRRLHGPRVVAPEAAQGYVPLALYPPDRRLGVAQAMTGVLRAQTLRCSCHEYRQLALGHAEFMLTPMLKPWDHAAGALVIEETGGAARLRDGRAYAPTIHTGEMAVAGSAAMAGTLLARFA